MVNEINNLILSKLSTVELSKYIKKVQLAIIPVGSHEQHGPNLAFAADTILAYEISKYLGKRLFPRVLICPPINFGNSYHHMDFPGTITLKPETFISLIMDIVESLKHHKINKVLLINGHGGNHHALGVAVAKLKFELGVKAGWIGPDFADDLLDDKNFSSIRGHACESEVSMSMFLAPWLVKNHLTKGKLNNTLYKKRYWWKQVPWSFKEITENGALGDATKSSYELGKEISEHVLKKYEEFIKEYFLNN